MDEIAVEIKEGCSFELRQRGVLLHTCRIVDLEFAEKEVPNPGDEGILGSAEASTMERKFHEDPTKHWVGDTSGSKGIEKAEKAKEDQISQKQIVAWSADWQRVAAETRAKGKAQADLLTQENARLRVH